MFSLAMKHEGWAECPIQSTLRLPSTRRSTLETVEPFLKAVRMGPFRFGQGLKPFRQLGEAFFAGRLRHARIHLSVFVCLAFNGRFQIGFRIPDRHPRRRVSDLLQKVEMPKGMASFGLRRIAEQTANVRVTFDISPPGEIEVAAVGLRFTGKCSLQVFMAL